MPFDLHPMPFELVDPIEAWWNDERLTFRHWELRQERVQHHHVQDIAVGLVDDLIQEAGAERATGKLATVVFPEFLHGFHVRASPRSIKIDLSDVAASLYGEPGQPRIVGA